MEQCVRALRPRPNAGPLRCANSACRGRRSTSPGSTRSSGPGGTTGICRSDRRALPLRASSHRPATGALIRHRDDGQTDVKSFRWRRPIYFHWGVARRADDRRLLSYPLHCRRRQCRHLRNPVDDGAHMPPAPSQQRHRQEGTAGHAHDEGDLPPLPYGNRCRLQR